LITFESPRGAARWRQERGSSRNHGAHGSEHQCFQYKAAGRDSTTPLRFKGQDIVPTDKVKLLGVTLDKELRFKVHLADRTGKATRVALALRRMKELQPKAVKQLAQSAVLPVVDYASPVWYPIATQDMKQLLLQSQRITAQAVIREFRTVALSVAEVEAGLLPMEQRLRKQTIAFWVSIHKLRQSHPHWMLKRQRLCTKHRSPLMRVAEMCADVRIDMGLKVSRTHARHRYQPGQVDLYVDASVRNGRAGIRVYARPSRVCVSKTVASGRTSH
jgi:hypothetical protein